VEPLNFLIHVAFGLSLAGLAAGLTYLMARHVRIMDIPNQRSMHKVPTPKSGGVAIVVTFLIGSLTIYKVAQFARIDPHYFWTFIAGGVGLAIVSFYDDVKQKSFFAKLAAQVICSVAITLAGLVLARAYIPLVGEVELGYFGYIVTILWVVGLTNTYNFMDGMDGLAGGVGLIATCFLCGIAFREDSAYVYLTSYVLAAGLGGFLIFNLPPARIFMGDVGSAFVGYAFAVLALLGAAFDRGHLSFYVVPLLLFQFIFDTLFTFFRRISRGEQIHQAHRTHLYQLLPQLGYSHVQVVSFHYAVAIVQGAAAFALLSIPSAFRVFVFVPFLLFNAYYAFWMISAARRRRLI
jgi:UDP-GlcNAc:undecaprenyl-phosphate GlcNAc-1-phosphate transferase